MTHEIDAAVDLVKAPALEPRLDLATRDARLQKLPPRDDPVLIRG